MEWGNGEFLKAQFKTLVGAEAHIHQYIGGLAREMDEFSWCHKILTLCL